MDTKKLRQKILDLAIHGKLVPQDPNDEPASVLLERIRAEKERLIAEGKIKRSKKSATSDTPHYENVPFEVPEGWCWSSIENVCSKFTTGPFGSMVHKSDYVTDGGVPMVNPANMIGGNISYNKLMFVSELRAKDLQKYRLEPSDILLARRGDLTKCVVIKNEQKDWLCGTGSFVLHTILLLPAYFELLYSSTYIQSILTSESVGATMDNLNQGLLGSIIIPIPPIEEQQRIVTSVGLWFSLINNLEFGYSELNQSIIKAKSKILDLAIHGKLVPQDTNDEPASELLKRINPKAVASCDNPQYGKVPSSWIISTVGEVFTINPKTHVEDDTEAAFVPMTCVSDGYSNTFEYECKKWGNIKKGFVHFQENDVAVAKISPCLENRKSVVFHDLPNGIGAGTTELNVFRCTEILPEYALFYFKSQMFIGSCAGTYNGVVGQQRVAKSFIQELPIGIPPYKEQMRIVSKVNDLFSQLDMIEKSLQA